MKKKFMFLLLAILLVLSSTFVYAQATSGGIGFLSDNIVVQLVRQVFLEENVSPWVLKFILFWFLFAIFYAVSSNIEHLKPKGGGKGVPITLSVVISLLAVIGIPNAIISSIFKLYGGLFSLLLIILPFGLVYYFLKKQKNLGAAGHVLIGILLFFFGIMLTTGFLMQFLGEFLSALLNDPLQIGGIILMILGIISFARAFTANSRNKQLGGSSGGSGGGRGWNPFGHGDSGGDSGGDGGDGGPGGGKDPLPGDDEEIEKDEEDGLKNDVKAQNDTKAATATEAEIIKLNDEFSTFFNKIRANLGLLENTLTTPERFDKDTLNVARTLEDLKRDSMTAKEDMSKITINTRPLVTSLSSTAKRMEKVRKDLDDLKNRNPSKSQEVSLLIRDCDISINNLNKLLKDFKGERKNIQDNLKKLAQNLNEFIIEAWKAFDRYRKSSDPTQRAQAHAEYVSHLTAAINFLKEIITSNIELNRHLKQSITSLQTIESREEEIKNLLSELLSAEAKKPTKSWEPKDSRP